MSSSNSTKAPRYKACNVCRIRKIRCDGVEPCGPCIKFSRSKGAGNSHFKFVDEDGRVACQYHEGRYNTPKYIAKSSSNKRRLSRNEEDEDSETVASLEDKIEKLQAVLNDLSVKKMAKESTWTPDIEDFSVGICPFVPPNLTLNAVPSPSPIIPSTSTHIPILFPDAENEILKFMSRPVELTPLERCQLPSAAVTRVLISEAFSTTLLASHILSEDQIVEYLNPFRALKSSETLLLHALCLLGIFSMRWDDLELLLSSQLPYWDPKLVAEDLSVEHCLAGNCCTVELYKTNKHINADAPRESQLKGSILQHHCQYVTRFMVQNVEEMQVEDDGRGLERLTRVSVLMSLYSEMRYNVNQMWRVKALRFSIMLGWNKEEVLRDCKSRERYERSMALFFIFSFESSSSIFRGDSPFLSSEDIHIPLPSSDFMNTRIWPHDPTFYTNEQPFIGLESHCISFKCALLLCKVAEFWRRIEHSSAGKLDIEAIESGEEFIAIASICKTFQRCFPVSQLAMLSYKSTSDITPTEGHNRDFLYKGQCLLSAAIILHHHRQANPLPIKLSPSFDISHGAAQIVLCLVPLFYRLLKERQHTAYLFSQVMGVAGKILFRNLLIIRQRDGDSEETFKMEMQFLNVVDRLRDLAKEWKAVAPMIIPLIILSKNPELCLEEDFALVQPGRI